MKKLFNSKYWWISLIVLLVLVNMLAFLFHFRIDLTSEKRFTLSQPTRQLLQNLKSPVRITVFLEGDMPAGFRQLSNASAEMLQEFREISNNNVVFSFEKPGAGLDDTAKSVYLAFLADSLDLKPTNVKVTAKAGESQEERLLYPGALVSNDQKQVPVNLLQGQSLEGGYNTLNNAEALLEYKFASAIQKINTDTTAAVGYLLGNGQPLTYNVFDLIEHVLKTNYRFGFLPLDSMPIVSPDFNVLIIVKPSRPFNDQQKLKLDQYVMHGGKIIWLIDNLYAEMDSLMRTQSDFIAFDRGLNLQDQLFKYGVRINPDLLQDLQSDKMPLVVGNFGNQPQMQLVPWPYFPLLSSYSANPISKNLGTVLSIFPNTMDTIEGSDIKKTVLLSSSDESRTLSTPAIVTLNSVKTEDDLKTFNQKRLPVAVLLEGKFSSLYANRIGSGQRDTLARIYKTPFISESAENKMIVISDADIVTNVVTQNEGPLPMGYNQFTHQQYANRDFILNCIEYLTSSSGIMETRSKDLTLRLLDVKKLEAGKTQWQLINIAVPVLLILLWAALYHTIRKRKYES
jgi:ABC-2 type transport system permease protein